MADDVGVSKRATWDETVILSERSSPSDDGWRGGHVLEVWRVSLVCLGASNDL